MKRVKILYAKNYDDLEAKVNQHLYECSLQGQTVHDIKYQDRAASGPAVSNGMVSVMIIYEVDNPKK
jgi:hypothetical protein